MILSDQSIQNVRDASITAVVGHYITLKNQGVARVGLCPFHDEKSPSFSVSETRGIYKCFGCGAGGDNINFVMRHKRLEFLEAVEEIARIVGIPLEYEEVQDKEKYEADKANKTRLKEVLRHAVEVYANNLWSLPDTHPVMNYLSGRNITRKIMAEWQLGWATEDWHSLSPSLITKGWYEPASKLGLIKRTQAGDSNYDGYRSRITIPITNRHGEYIGMGGRFHEIDPADKNKQNPKYINSPENELYNKSLVLFGLSHAEKGINRSGFSFLVEGYFDVITMHANRDNNAVATCGTALTENQAKLLRKYTSHVVILRDGDKAGQAAATKDLPLLLQQGFTVEICLLPDKEDPDSYTQKLIKNHYLAGEVHAYDALMWQVDLYVKYVDAVFNMGMAQDSTIHLLLKVSNELVRNHYFDAIVKKYKWKAGPMQKKMNELLEARQQEDDGDDGETQLDKMPKFMDKEEFLKQGYCVVNSNKRTGYYSFSGGGHVEITNFIIRPLFHIYAGSQSRHLVQIDNGRQKAVLDIESKALVSPDLLQQLVVCEGPFIIYGSKAQMLRVATNLLGNFPRCMEVKFLGWQQAGFFAFVDKVYVPGKGVLDLDEWGILKHNDQNYLVPAASAAYRELQATGDDPYEMDRVLEYRVSNIKFSDWAAKMNRVYVEKGPVAIAYILLTVFRDIVFDVDNNCPHLYCFGEKSSGKSKWAESIMAFFFNNRPAFNLNSGTDFAFFSYMQRFINCTAALNEFDEKVIKPEWFQAIKGIFDGEGRQRGVMGSKNRTEIMKIRSTLVLMGQYLVTMDDNSVVTRSIIEGFNTRELTSDDKAHYDQLKAMEAGGLGNLMIELLQLRPAFKEHYRNSFNETLSIWRKTMDSDAAHFNQRIMQNWCHLFTCWKLASQTLDLPVLVSDFEAYCKQKSAQWSSFIRSSDSLSDFWNTLTFLVDQGDVVEGWDYKIQEVLEVRIRKDRDNEYSHPFPEPTKVLFLRMNNIHKHYQQAYRSRSGKEGMSIENLLHYFSSRKYFLGAHKQSRFKRFVVKTENVTRSGLVTVTMAETSKQEEQIVSSSYVFLYSDLELDLERVAPEDHYVPPAGGYQPMKDVDFTNKEAPKATISELPFGGKKT